MEPGVISTEKECLLEIINRAYDKSTESKEIGITEILKSYDDFLAIRNIDSKSELASELYKAIIRASRNKTGDWFQKITNDSMLKQSGDFGSLHSSEKDRNFFSFGEPLDFKSANALNSIRVSLRRTSGAGKRDSIADYLPEKDVPSEQGSEEKQQQQLQHEDLSKIYRNRYVADISLERAKPKRVTIAEELEDKAHKSGLLGLSSVIGPYDLSPIREQRQLSEMPTKLPGTQSEEYRKDTGKLSSTGYANRYLNQTHSTQLNEFTVTSPQGGNQSSNRKVFSSQERINRFRSTSDHMDDQQTKTSFHVESPEKTFGRTDAQILHAYFQALRIHTLRLKRARRTAEEIREMKDQRIKEHIFYILKNLLTIKAIAKNDMIHAYSLYEKNMLAKCFAGMKQYTRAVRSFRSQKYGFEGKKTHEVTQKVYDAWKNMVAEKKHDDVAVYTARYLREKTLTKKAMKSFVHHLLRKKELRVLSLQCYRKYKAALVNKCFNALKQYKVTKEQLENAKIERIERSLFFARKRGFAQLKKGVQRTLNKTQGKRNVIELIQMKAKRTFFQKLREYIKCKKIMLNLHDNRNCYNSYERKNLTNRAFTYHYFSILRRFFEAWKLQHINTEFDEHRAEEYYLEIIKRKGFFGWKGWFHNPSRKPMQLNDRNAYLSYLFFKAFPTESGQRALEDNFALSQTQFTLGLSKTAPMKPIQDDFLSGDLQFEIPRIGAVSSNFKQANRFTIANLSLLDYIKQRIFSSWKETTQIRKSFRAKVESNFLKRYFQSWKVYSNRHMIKKYDNYLANSSLKKIYYQKSFSQWVEFTKNSKKFKALFQKCYQRSSNRIKRLYLAKMVSAYKESVQERQNIQKAKEFGLVTHCETPFLFWAQYAKQKAKGERIKHTMLKKRVTRNQTKVFAAWKEWCQHQQTNRAMIKCHREKFGRKLLQRILLSWKKINKAQASRRKMVELFRKKYSMKLCKRIIKAFKLRLRAKKVKLNLIKKLDARYNKQITERVFKELKQYVNSRRNKRVWDRFVTKRMQRIPIKNFFNTWNKNFRQRLGIRNLCLLVPQLQKKMFFKNMALQTYKLMKIIQVLHKSRDYHCKRIHFMALKKISNKKNFLRDNQERFADELLMRRFNSSFTAWRRAYLYERNSRYLLAYTIIHIKNQLLAKYYHGLKRNWKVQQFARRYLDQRIRKAMVIGLRGWNAYTKRQNELRHLEFNVEKQRTLAIKSTFLNAWRDGCYQIKKSEVLEKVLHRVQKHKFLKAWVEKFNIDTGSNIVLKRVFDVTRGVNMKFLRTRVERMEKVQKNYSRFYNDLKSFERRRVIQTMFEAWKRYKNKVIGVRVARGVFEHPYRTRNKFFYVWLNATTKRMDSYKRAGAVFNRLAVFLKKYYFRKLKTVYAQSVARDNLCEEIDVVRAQRLKQGTFEALLRHAWERKTKQQKNDMSLNHYAQSLMKKALVCLYYQKNQKISRRLVQEDAGKFWYYKTAKKILKGWSELCTRKQIINYHLANRQLERRQVYGQQFMKNLKYLFYLRQIKNVLLPRATKYRERRLSIRAFLALKLHHSKQIERTLQNQRADNQYAVSLAIKALQSWLNYFAKKRVSHLKREKLFLAITTVNNSATLREVFDTWRVYATESKDFLKDARSMLNENALSRLFSSWKSYTDQRIETKQSQNAKISQINAKVRGIYFQKWKRQFKLSSVLERVAYPKILQVLSNVIKVWADNARLEGEIQTRREESSRRIAAYCFFALKSRLMNKKKFMAKAKVINQQIKRKFFEKIRVAYIYEKQIDLFAQKRLNVAKYQCFYSWKNHCLKRRTAKHMCEAKIVRLAAKCFKSLYQNSEERKWMKNVIAKYLHVRITNEQDVLLTRLNTWRENAQEETKLVAKLEAAKARHDFNLLLHSFTNWERYVRKAQHQRKSLNLLSEVAGAIEAKFLISKAMRMWRKRTFQISSKTKAAAVIYKNIFRAMRPLKKLKNAAAFATIAENFESKLIGYRVALLKREFMFRLFKNFEHFETASVKAYNFRIACNFSLKRMIMNQMKIYLEMKRDKRQLEQKASSFYESTLQRFKETLFRSWLQYTLENEESLKNRTDLMMYNLMKSRLGSFFRKLKKQTTEKQAITQKVDPGNPQFKSFVENRVKSITAASFNKFKAFVQERKRRAEIQDMIVAKSRELNNRKLLMFYFRVLKNIYYENKTRSVRSKLYAVFTSWKMFAREKILLKKYLRESNLNEEFAYTPTATQRSRLRETIRAPLESISLSSQLSSSFSNTMKSISSPYKSDHQSLFQSSNIKF